MRNTFKYSCQFCDYKAVRNWLITAHQARYHEDLIPNAEFHHCNQCQYRSALKDTLKRHIQVVHLKSGLKCETCGNNFAGNGALKRHINSVHRGIKHHCDICSKAYGNRSNVFIHMRKEHPDKLAKCTICEKDFLNFGELAEHVKSVHQHYSGCKPEYSETNSQENYLCFLCPNNIIFFSKTHLNIHLSEVHTMNAAGIKIEFG